MITDCREALDAKWGVLSNRVVKGSMYFLENLDNLVLSGGKDLIFEREREDIRVTKACHVADGESKVLCLNSHISHGWQHSQWA